MTTTLPGTWREPHREVQFPIADAKQAWTQAAVPVLKGVASRYGGYCTYKELARLLFEATGIHTRQQLNHWIGDVLAGVITECKKQELPELTSLVVGSSDGMVGSGFNAVLIRSGRQSISEPYELEMTAAEERLKCYRVYCPDLPTGAAPQLTREYSAQVHRATKSAPRVRAVCPGCGMQLPATGICDDCQ